MLVRSLDVVEGLKQVEHVLVLVEQLAHKGRATAGSGQDEDMGLPGGVVGEVGDLLTAPELTTFCLLPPETEPQAQAAVHRAGDWAQLEGLSGEGPYGCVLDGYRG